MLEKKTFGRSAYHPGPDTHAQNVGYNGKMKYLLLSLEYAERNDNTI
jgi:hypothetical protein